MLPAPLTDGLIDRNWAQWPMPNSLLEVQGGAPNPQHYTRHAATVSDDVTGLTWDHPPFRNAAFASLSFAQAEAHCSSLSASGHHDWRIPTAIELLSIVDRGARVVPEEYGAPGPDVANSHAFPRTPAKVFWTATPVIGADKMWAVNFLAGVVTSAPLSEQRLVRCVRGGPPGPYATLPERARADRYSLVADGAAVRDNKTHLVWERTNRAGDSEPFPPERGDKAVKYCAGLSLAGRTGWRLPTIGELLTLVDFSARIGTPMVDPTYFPGSPSWYFRSASLLVGEEDDTRWVLYMGFLALEGFIGGTYAHFRCVLSPTEPPP